MSIDTNLVLFIKLFIAASEVIWQPQRPQRPPRSKKTLKMNSGLKDIDILEGPPVDTSIGPETPFSTMHLLDCKRELEDQVFRRTNARLFSQSVLSELVQTSTDKCILLKWFLPGFKPMAPQVILGPMLVSTQLTDLRCIHIEAVKSALVYL